MNIQELNRHLGNIDIYLLDQILKGRFDRKMRILDVGCGEGRNLIYLLREDFQVFGVDQNPMAIQMALCPAVRNTTCCGFRWRESKTCLFMRELFRQWSVPQCSILRKAWRISIRCLMK